MLTTIFFTCISAIFCSSSVQDRVLLGNATRLSFSIKVRQVKNDIMRLPRSISLFVLCFFYQKFHCTLLRVRGGSSLICNEGCRFSMGWCIREPHCHSPLQSATLPSQHYYYLKGPNLHVRRSVTFYIIFCLYRLFITYA